MIYCSVINKFVGGKKNLLMVFTLYIWYQCSLKCYLNVLINTQVLFSYKSSGL